MNNLIKILLGILFVFIIILCILKQPLNKCNHNKEGIDNTMDDSKQDPDELENNVRFIKKTLTSMQPTIATQASLDMIITTLNGIKKDIANIHTRYR